MKRMTDPELVTRFAGENGVVAVPLHGFRCECCFTEFLISLVKPSFCPACGECFGLAAPHSCYSPVPTTSFTS